MLGGGIFTTQNKVLPGSYINVVGKSSATSPLGERGVVAIALPLKTKGVVTELTKDNFPRDAKSLFGVEYTDKSLMPLREIFKNSQKIYVYDLGKGPEGKSTVADVTKALEGYEFNILVAYTGVTEDISAYVSAVKTYRDNGKKCQLVAYKATTPNTEGVVNVTTAAQGDDEFAVVAWVGGALAGCAIQNSCTNKVYDGELTLTVEETQAELERRLQAGEFILHRVYDEVRVLEDVNSLTTFTEEKTEDFKYNQTVRIADQIVNDIAKTFNNQFLGKVRNDASGRASLWGRIEKHHRELEKVGAIEPFDSDLLKVEKGTTKRSVVITDCITPINAMAQIYMTIVVE